MGASHGHALRFHGHSRVHLLPAHVKIVALVAFVFAVVATPKEMVWPYGLHLLTLLIVVWLSGVPLGYLSKRLLVEVPFLVFAFLMPFFAVGPRIEVGPFYLSQAGLWGAWALIAKGALGVFASLLLAATTEPRDIIAGLERLRMPQLLVQIMGFMLRYVEVITGELTRMRIARDSRCFQARSMRSWPILGASLGALFIRTYERGERVHLAMLARGYSGRVPTLRVLHASAAQWASGAMLLLASALICMTAVATS